MTRLRNELLGSPDQVHEDLDGFLDKLEATPEDCAISVRSIDEDGDLRFLLRIGGQTTGVWLDGAALKEIGNVNGDGYSSRVAEVIEKIAAVASDNN